VAPFVVPSPAGHLADARSGAGPPDFKATRALGVTAQREIETAVLDADAKGLLKGDDPLPVKAVVTVGDPRVAVSRAAIRITCHGNAMVEVMIVRPR
jgi:Family of unknown function (DUF6494)